MTDVSRLPGPMIDAWEWQYEAACRDLDTVCSSTPRVSAAPRADAVQQTLRQSARPARLSSSAGLTLWPLRSLTASGVE